PPSLCEVKREACLRRRQHLTVHLIALQGRMPKKSPLGVNPCVAALWGNREERRPHSGSEKMCPIEPLPIRQPEDRSWLSPSSVPPGMPEFFRQNRVQLGLCVLAAASAGRCSRLSCHSARFGQCAEWHIVLANHVCPRPSVFGGSHSVWVCV